MIIPIVVGALLLIGFVFHALNTKHPLIDLRLFRNRAMTFSVLTMMLFAIAFFGSGLLLPSYLQQVRGETALAAGLLIAPQGLGAMLTMPIAGRLVDKIGPGKIVLFGVALLSVGMLYFTQLTSDSSYWVMCAALFVTGLGMGCTMMPIMTAAIQTLTHEQVARGSTLMNIVNQTAGSIGTATISVVLANLLKDQMLAGPAIASNIDPAIAQQLGPEAVAIGLAQAADAFADTYVVAVVLIVLTLIPAFFLPRTKPPIPEGADTKVLVH